MLNKLIKLIIYIIIFITLNSFGYRYVFYKNRKFPLDDGRKDIKFIQDENITYKDNISNMDSRKCNVELKSDMICDITSNVKECDFDGGDCCRPSCKKLCEEKNIPQEECPCGSGGYSCMSEDTGGCENCIHGKCITNMENCYADVNDIKLGIKSCKLNSNTNGNMNTSNYYCGKDPLKNIVHIRSSPNTHYPGCGLETINCTLLPCCTQVEMNSDTPENCNSIPTNRFVYDNSLESFELKFISCIESYRNCFKENASGSPRGQCCICDEGWGGPFCDIPLCERCIHGTCIGRNKCKCDDNYEGEYCNIAVCSSCVNGECIEPEKCECFYGYKGKHCEEAETTPFCYRGKEIFGDKCECEDGYKGHLCEIKKCYDDKGNEDLTCDACDEEGNCYKRINKSCERIHPYCLECDIDNLKCTKCDESKNYFLNEINGNCVPLWQKINNCFKGNENKCTECIYPYFINEDKNECVYSGMIEINQLYFDILISDFEKDAESNKYNMQIILNRLYGFSGKCTIDYKFIPKYFIGDSKDNEIDYYINNPLNFSPLSNGRITFEENEYEKKVNIQVFYLNKFFFKKDSSVSNIFVLEISNNVGNCIIGDIHKSEIEIFDDNNIGDILGSLKVTIYSNSLPLEAKEGIQNYYKVFLDTEKIICNIEKTDSNIEKNSIENYFINLNLIKTDSDKSIELSKIIKFNSETNAFKGEINYEELIKNIKHKGDVKKLEFNTCCCSKTDNNIYNQKIFKMEFYNYAGIIEGEDPYYRRYVSYLDIDDYYKINHIGYYSVKWSFYLNKPKNLFYLKIIKNIDSYITLISNRKIIANLNYKLNTELFYELIYEINSNDNLESHEFIIEYIHISGEPKITVEYSEDNINYEDISSQNDILHFFSCEYLYLYSLEIY